MSLETLLQSTRPAISILPLVALVGYLLRTLEQPPAAIRLVFPYSITSLPLGTEVVFRGSAAHHKSGNGQFKALFGDSRDEAQTQTRISKPRSAICTRGNNNA